MRKSLKKAIAGVAKLMVRAHLIRKQIIIKVDGGICSQMHFFLVGRILSQHGNRIVYDLSWFKDSGMDLDGRFCRNFDLLKLFPNLKFDSRISPILRRLYISSFYHFNDVYTQESSEQPWWKLNAPLFLDGYFKDNGPLNTALRSESFRHTFKPKIDAVDSKRIEPVLKSIENSTRPTCAMHVRRGDLAKYNKAYGYPVESEYFVKALREVENSEDGAISCFIFSDEPNWCRQELLPLLEKSRLNSDTKMMICDANGSDKGYLDLYLLSRCRNVICSQGSMGKYGALLRNRKQSEGLVVLPARDSNLEWLPRFSSSISI